jgi:adenylate cyclase
MKGFPKKLSHQLSKRWEINKSTSSSDPKTIKLLDKKIYNDFERVVSPMVIDMVGFTKTANRYGIAHYLSMVEMMRQTIAPVITTEKGTLVKAEADNLFAYFKTPSKALRVMKKIHKVLKNLNNGVSESHRIELSAGIGYGPTLLTNGDMWGADFNISCKLGEDLAEAGEILLSESAWRKLSKKRTIFQDRSYSIGDQTFKAHSVYFDRL